MDEPKVAVLRHYASPYYDPQKAHEYYMRTRELKGAFYHFAERRWKEDLVLYKK